MSNDSVEVRAVSMIWKRSIGVLISERGFNGRRDWLPIKWKLSDVRSDHEESEATLNLPHEVALKLYEALGAALKDVNIHPANESKLTGQVESMKYHLEDLRKMLKLK